MDRSYVPNLITWGEMVDMIPLSRGGRAAVSYTHLFNTDFTGTSRDNRKWLLTQAAMVEMYARLAVFANQSL